MRLSSPWGKQASQCLPTHIPSRTLCVCRARTCLCSSSMSKGSQQEVGSEGREDGAVPESCTGPAQATLTIPTGKSCVSLQILRVKAASSKAEQCSCSSRSSSSCGQGKGRDGLSEAP